jgi:hypothetical protein
MFRQGGMSLSPAIDAIDTQLQFSYASNLLPRLQQNLASAQAKMATINPANKVAYANALSTVVMLQQRISSTVTQDQLLTEKISLLQSIYSSNLAATSNVSN